MCHESGFHHDQRGHGGGCGCGGFGSCEPYLWTREEKLERLERNLERLREEIARTEKRIAAVKAEK